jgi:hypothetical protein
VRARPRTLHCGPSFAVPVGARAPRRLQPSVICRYAISDARAGCYLACISTPVIHTLGCEPGQPLGTRMRVSGVHAAGQAASHDELCARVVIWPPSRLAWVRCERESVVVAWPVGSRVVSQPREEADEDHRSRRTPAPLRKSQSFDRGAIRERGVSYWSMDVSLSSARLSTWAMKSSWKRPATPRSLFVSGRREAADMADGS